MSEQDPRGRIDVGDYSMEVTRRSARLVHYFAQTAFNHIRIEDEEYVMFMFRSLMQDQEKYDMLEEFMLEAEMPFTCDEQKIGAEVMRAFDMTTASMAHLEGDYIPEDWQL